MVPGDILNLDKIDGIRHSVANGFEGDNIAITCENFNQQFEWYLYAIKADYEPDRRETIIFHDHICGI